MIIQKTALVKVCKTQQEYQLIPLKATAAPKRFHGLFGMSWRDKQR